MERAATVLIADSTEEFTNALSAALQRTEGFQVVGTAADGEQAIRLIGERKPDLLVLDMMLSKKDGISVLRAISGMSGGQRHWQPAYSCRIMCPAVQPAWVFAT